MITTRMTGASMLIRLRVVPGQPWRKLPTHLWVERTVTDGSDRGAASVRTREHFDWNARVQRRVTVTGRAKTGRPQPERVMTLNRIDSRTGTTPQLERASAGR